MGQSDRLPSRVFHFNGDAMKGHLGSIQNPPGRLRRHMDHQTSFAIPGLRRPYDIAIGRKLSAIQRNVMNWRLNPVEYKNRWPTVMMYGFLVLGSQS